MELPRRCPRRRRRGAAFQGSTVSSITQNADGTTTVKTEDGKTYTFSYEKDVNTLTSEEIASLNLPEGVQITDLKGLTRVTWSVTEEDQIPPVQVNEALTANDVVTVSNGKYYYNGVELTYDAATKTYTGKDGDTTYTITETQKTVANLTEDGIAKFAGQLAEKGYTDVRVEDGVLLATYGDKTVTLTAKTVVSTSIIVMDMFSMAP